MTIIYKYNTNYHYIPAADSGILIKSNEGRCSSHDYNIEIIQ